jgi:hypothetical protein
MINPDSTNQSICSMLDYLINSVVIAQATSIPTINPIAIP